MNINITINLYAVPRKCLIVCSPNFETSLIASANSKKVYVGPRLLINNLFETIKMSSSNYDLLALFSYR